MGDEQPTGGQPTSDTPQPTPPRPSFAYRYEDDPPTSPRRGLPTWAWVIMILFFVLIGLPILLIGALFLYCTFIDTKGFSVVQSFPAIYPHITSLMSGCLPG